MSYFDLPVELKEALVEELTGLNDVLLKCRLISKEFKDLATPRAFRTLNISTKSGSYAAFTALPLDTKIFEHVKQVDFRVSRKNPMTFVGVADSIGPYDPVEDTAAMFSCLAKCPNLRCLRLYFPTDNKWQRERTDNYCIDDLSPMESTYSLQCSIFNALASLAPAANIPASTLEIHGLLTRAICRVRSLKAHSFLGTLQKLIISVVTADPDDFENQQGFQRDYGQFWKYDLPMFLSSTSNLTSLTFTSDIYTSSFAPWGSKQWSELIFPSLHSLTLHKLVFRNPTYYAQSRNGGLEEFILRHQETLSFLDISSCVMEIAENDINPRSWANVLDNFRVNLKNLRSFRFNPLSNTNASQAMDNPDQPAGDEGEPETSFTSYEGYVYFSIDDGEFAPLTEVPFDGNEDKRALEALQVAIGQRTS